jgi:hypothetical protein
MQFLYVKVPVANQPPERTRRLTDMVDQVLLEAGVGAVAGWGASLGGALPDGTRPVAYTRIDVDVLNLPSARAFLRANLPSAGAPIGTEIHFTTDRRHYKDLYADSRWLVDQPC